MAPKMAQKLVKNTIILGSIFGTIFSGFRALWVPLGSLHGLFEAVLGSLGPQKPWKTKGFLGFCKCRFVGLWSSWGLSWAHLGRFLGWSGPQIAPKMAPKVAQKLSKNWSKKWPPKMWNLSQFWAPKWTPKWAILASNRHGHRSRSYFKSSCFQDAPKQGQDVPE